MIHNSELEQFSYTVSHNLRGPVASLLGLISIYRLSLTSDERDNILKLLEQSALSLETIIRDLNKIIDIRHDKFTTFEEVSFDTELTLIKQSLESFLQENEVTIKSDFECKKITSTKAYINSILYNLISNGIQYRSPNRKPVITLITRNHSDRIRIEVSDNGLGMDLNRFGNDVFKLYKRFHTHIQGKGLGLYLVKQQVEKLNGDIKVESTPDQGTTFKISFPAKG
jgi:signal transduction histidine kinase